MTVLESYYPVETYLFNSERTKQQTTENVEESTRIAIGFLGS